MAENIAVYPSVNTECEKKRKRNWTTDECRLLIQIWAENYPDLKRAKRNKTIYEKIRCDMCYHGYNRTADEVRKKISNLTAIYRSERTAHTSSGASRSQWEYYEMIHNFLGTNPMHDPKCMHESSILLGDTNASFEEIITCEMNDLDVHEISVRNEAAASPSTSFTPDIASSILNVVETHSNSVSENPKKKRRKEVDDYGKQILSLIQTTNEEIKKNDQCIIELIKTQNKLLEQLLNKN